MKTETNGFPRLTVMYKALGRLLIHSSDNATFTRAATLEVIGSFELWMSTMIFHSVPSIWKSQTKVS